MGRNEIIISLNRVKSTMDTARFCMRREKYCLVSAESQSRGRGTQDRQWQSPPGNIYMTIGIRENCIYPERKLLLPLESGLITYEILHNCLPLENRQQLEIKWPNDIHLKERKVCGLLLEKHEGRYFIGIGINIIQAPHLAVGMRPSGRLADFGLKLQDNKSLIHDIYNAFKEKTREIRSPEQVLKKWKQHICWNKPVTLRQNPESPVIPVDVSPDGMLAVRLPDGSVKWLRTEYLS